MIFLCHWKLEWLKGIVDGSRSLKAFLALAGESISERESKRFEEGLNTKVKLTLYKTFGKAIEFKKYFSRADFLLKLQEKLGNGSGRRRKLALALALALNYMVMTHPSLSPQPGIWWNLLGSRGRVVRMCVRVVSLTLVSFTHLILV